MRGFCVALLLVPSLAYAQPAPGIDVHIDLHLDAPAPPSVETLSPPSEVAPLPDRTTPRRWVALGGGIGLGHVDGASSGRDDPSWTARADVDVARHGAWLAGVAAAIGGDQRMIDYLGPADMYGYSYGYDEASILDVRAVGYLACVMRRGRWELRAQGGLGLVATAATRSSSSAYDTQPTDVTFSPIAELGASVSVDLYGPVAFAIGPLATMFNQRFAAMTSDPSDRLQRGVDLALQSSLRWRL
ncbi:MAG: hypothetical protein ACM31C_32950 [Acidobacteriota bacterium]